MEQARFLQALPEPEPTILVRAYSKPYYGRHPAFVYAFFKVWAHGSGQHRVNQLEPDLWATSKLTVYNIDHDLNFPPISNRTETDLSTATSWQSCSGPSHFIHWDSNSAP